MAPFELPIGAEQEFRGIADLLHEKADLYPSGPQAEESEWPEDLHAMADPAREKLIEAVAESDDALIEEYLESGTLPEEHIVSGAKDGFAAPGWRRSSAARPPRRSGIDRLLDFIVEEFPSPADREPITVVAKDGAEETRGAAGSESAVRLRVQDGVRPVRRAHHDVPGVLGPGGARLERLRREQGSEERISQLFTLRGKEHETVSAIGPGDIGAVAKLQHAHTGDTWSTKDKPVTLPAVALPEPLLAYAIAPASKGEEDKLSTGLTRTSRGGPLVSRRANEETHETVIYGMGEAHLGVQMQRLNLEVRRRGRAPAGEDRLPRDDPGPRLGARAAT